MLTEVENARSKTVNFSLLWFKSLQWEDVVFIRQSSISELDTWEHFKSVKWCLLKSTEDTNLLDGDGTSCNIKCDILLSCIIQQTNPNYPKHYLLLVHMSYHTYFVLL